MDEPAALRQAALALHARVLAFDVSLDEGVPPDDLAADVIAPLVELLGDGATLLGHVQRLGPVRAPDVFGDDEPRSLVRSRSVVDASFLGALELDQRAARLTHAGHARDVATLAEAAAALHALARVVAETERALALGSDVAPSLPSPSPLDDALLTRRTVARARAIVKPAERPSSADLGRRLHLGAVAVAALTPWTATPTLALEDRAAVLALHHALVAWLASPADDVAAALWDHLVALLDDLERVQVRRDVFAHDAALVARALETVGEDVADVPPSTLERLARIEGASPSVDALLASPWRNLASAWRPLLVRLGDRLGAS